MTIYMFTEFHNLFHPVVF